MTEPLSSMAVDELIGQLFMVGFIGLTPTPAILDLIQRRHVGGIILFSRNVADSDQLLTLTSALQAAARAAGQRHPLLIAIDQENGIVRRLGQGSTIFPGNMALGATDSDELAYAVAYATGRELRALGINLNLAPVVDVNNNPANPVIGVRAFGADPALVARLGAAATRGYQAAGVIAALKHFPGHGDTAVDSHQAMPVLDGDLNRLEAVELLPFRVGIAAGAASVMIAHVALPRLTAGEAVPATLAPEIVRGLLRERMGYDGLVLSDCLEMRAIADTVGTAPGSVRALRAGVDLVLVSHRADRQRASLAAVRAALDAGMLDHETITRAAERVLRLKAHWLAWERLPTAATLAEVGAAAHHELATRAYARSTTLARDVSGLIPIQLDPAARLVVLSLMRDGATSAEDRDYAAAPLLAEIARRHATVTAVTLAPDASLAERTTALAAVHDADLTLLVTLNAHRDPAQLALARAAIAAGGGRVIGLAAANPYDASALPELGTVLLTYEYTAPALAAAVRVLFGEAEAQGKAPVALAAPASGE